MVRDAPIQAAALLLFVTGTAACTQSGGPGQAENSVPAGMDVVVELEEELDPRVQQVGDQFTARVNDPVEATRAAAIPAGSVIRGRVTGVRRRDSDGAAGDLSVAFEWVEVGGERRHLSAEVIRLAPEPETDGRRSRGRTARVTDTGVDAAPGTRIAFAPSGEPVLPEGAVLRLELTAPVEVPPRPLP